MHSSGSNTIITESIYPDSRAHISAASKWTSTPYTTRLHQSEGTSESQPGVLEASVQVTCRATMRCSAKTRWSSSASTGEGRASATLRDSWSRFLGGVLQVAEQGAKPARGFRRATPPGVMPRWYTCRVSRTVSEEVARALTRLCSGIPRQ